MNVAQALSMAINSDKEDRVKEIMKAAPSGSGFDAGTELDDKSTPKKLIFNTSYHHMNEAGFYIGWTDHKVIITPSFDGMDIKLTGKDYNAIKDYIADVFWGWVHADHRWQK